MFRSLYYSTALALLPTAESVTKKFEQLVKKLDTLTLHYEGFLEEKAVALAKNARDRRTALQSVYAAIDNFHAMIERIIASVEASFERRERRILTDIGSLRAKLDKASDARDAVANVLGL